jgi:Rrf2 family protein
VFSTTFRYGLICLLELAGADALLQAGAIASRHQLSQHYLSVVLAELRRLGLVQSQKGKSGGYRLIRQPSEVNLLFLYRALAGSAPADAGCLDGVQRPLGAGDEPPQPPIATGNPADAWLQAISRRWSAELEATSLEDLQVWALRSGSGDGTPPLPSARSAGGSA